MEKLSQKENLDWGTRNKRQFVPGKLPSRGHLHLGSTWGQEVTRFYTL